jgi:uncharacterized protein (TIGR03435 family)
MGETLARVRIGIVFVVLTGACRAQSGTERFEVASVRPGGNCVGGGGVRLGITVSPGRLSIKCQTVDFLLRQAFLANGRDPLFADPQVYNQTIKGTPSWVTSERYTIDARAEGTPDRETMLGPMLAALLEDRFRLKIHREQKEALVYALTVAKSGPRLEQAMDRSCAQFDADKPEPPEGMHICGILIRSVKPGAAPASFFGATMADFCRGLSRVLNREVVDKTGIAGRFDIRLDVSLADLFPRAAVLAHQAPGDPDATAAASDPQGSSLFSAVQKLGLKLESAKGLAELLVVDRIERLSEN